MFVVDRVVRRCRGTEIGFLVGYYLEGDGVGSHCVAAEDVHCFMEGAACWFVVVE